MQRAEAPPSLGDVDTRALGAATFLQLGDVDTRAELEKARQALEGEKAELAAAQGAVEAQTAEKEKSDLALEA